MSCRPDGNPARSSASCRDRPSTRATRHGSCAPYVSYHNSDTLLFLSGVFAVKLLLKCLLKTEKGDNTYRWNDRTEADGALCGWPASRSSQSLLLELASMTFA